MLKKMLKKTRLLILSVLILFVLTNCDFNRPTGPSHYSEYFTESEVADVKLNWDPYVGVHPFGIYENTQQPHLEKLINAGMLRGVRLENLDDPVAQSLAMWFHNYEVEVLGLFENEYLRNPDICQIFTQQHVVPNPRVKVWEIGNEVDFMTPEEYIRIFKELYNYAKINHPDIILIPHAPSGTHGGAEIFRRMIDAGLDKLELPIIAIHFYSTESLDGLANFRSQLAKISISTRIWITETSAGDWAKEINHVRKMYPQLRSLGVERIFKHVFSEGCKEGGNSLVKICESADFVKYSPLMKLLIEEPGASTVASGPESTSINNTGTGRKVEKRTEKHGSDKKYRRQR